MSVLMVAFVIALSGETPDQKAAMSKLMGKYLPENTAIEGLRKLQRPEFFAKTLHCLSEICERGLAGASSGCIWQHRSKSKGVPTHTAARLGFGGGCLVTSATLN